MAVAAGLDTRPGATLPFARYSTVAIVLHWLIALVIIFELAVGMTMERIPVPHLRIPIVQLHSSLGVGVLLLSLSRLSWRIGHIPPPLPSTLAPWERRAANGTHAALYVMMILMPLVGWSILSTSARALRQGQYLFWTALRWPPLPILSRIVPPFQGEAHARFVLLHTIGGFIMIALLLAHVAGAVKHQWFDGQRQFARMWFERR